MAMSPYPDGTWPDEALAALDEARNRAARRRVAACDAALDKYNAALHRAEHAYSTATHRAHEKYAAEGEAVIRRLIDKYSPRVSSK